MTQPYRLPAGGRIDRSRPFTFRYDGRSYTGYAGDTLASALLANGVRIVGRSFKYHRPRGVFGAGVEEPNALVQLLSDGDTPNVPATGIELADGLEARAVNCRPSAERDLGSALGLFARILPAGFYYKTFMWPAGLWMTYERYIRRMAGLGRTPRVPPEGRAETRFDHCDVLVVGAGPAGLAAALAATRAGCDVMLVEDQAEPGGSLLGEDHRIEGRPALDWVDDVAAELRTAPNCRLLPRATAFGCYDDNLVTIFERRPAETWLQSRIHKVLAARIVFATGSIERPIAFPNNDLPGVMLASAARTYARRFSVLPGRRAVVVGNNNSAYEAAIALQEAGVDVAALVDWRRRPPQALAARIEAAGTKVLAGHLAAGARGRRGVCGIDILSRDGTGRPLRVDCDMIAASGGWSPVVHLHAQRGGQLDWDATQHCFRPDESIAAAGSAGAAAGHFDLAACLSDGFAAGAAAAQALGRAAAVAAAPASTASLPLELESCWEMRAAGRRGKAFVDLQNDVTTDDLRLALREGYRSIEHVKRYTTTGMAVDQGKTGNLVALGVVAEALGRTPPDIGTTTFRPPYKPIPFGAIAGSCPSELLIPQRRTPMTEWHIAAGAMMYDAAAGWIRPGYYPLRGESMSDAIRREVEATRAMVGFYDSSPLGKIEVHGPDALIFLDRIYANDLGGLAPGTGRYGLMLREDGRCLDDGIAFCLNEDSFLLSTTTGNADAVTRWLTQLLHTEWRDLKVFVTSVTSQWANCCICGPRARDVVARLGTDIDLTPSRFPFMGLREGKVAGFPARVARVSFTGELSFEINLPARHGLALWKAVEEAGRPFGITPVGSEANHVMRVEKGFISIGHEADGMANPYDLGLGWIVSKRKADFIGKRSLARDRSAGRPRAELVGLLTEPENLRLAEGAQVVEPASGGVRPIGFVTASVDSPTLGRPIALALVSDGRNRIGESVTVALKNGPLAKANVTKPVFFDPEGARLRS